MALSTADNAACVQDKSGHPMQHRRKGRIDKSLIHRMNSTQTNCVTATGRVPDGAGGMSASWYVAIVNHNAERTVATRVEALGYDTYVAMQPELRVRAGGRRVRVERIVIPCIVFVRCTEAQRRAVVKIPGVNRFMTDRAAGAARRPATVPPAQMAILRFMLGQSNIPVDFVPSYSRGDRVRVARGPLRGLTGEVATARPATTGTTHSPAISRNVATPQPSDTDPATTLLIVRLDVLGCATMTIPAIDLEPLRT